MLAGLTLVDDNPVGDISRSGWRTRFRTHGSAANCLSRAPACSGRDARGDGVSCLCRMLLSARHVRHSSLSMSAQRKQRKVGGEGGGGGALCVFVLDLLVLVVGQLLLSFPLIHSFS